MRLWPFVFNVNVQLASSEDVHSIKHMLATNQILLEKIMNTLDQVLAKVQGETTRLDSLAALVVGLEQQVKDALSGQTLPPDVQAKVDAIFAAASANSDKIDAALNTNVPAPAVAATEATDKVSGS